MKNNKRFMALILLVTTVLFVTGCGNESLEKDQEVNFPNKDIKLIVPYDAGGGVDITTRIFAETLKKHEKLNGHTVVVENKGGGGAVIGHTFVHTQPADGYTVLAFTNAAVNNPLFKEVTYKTEDFKPLAMVCFDPDILVVPPNSKFNTLQELLEYAKSNPVKVSTPGHSTVHHMAATILQDKMDLKFDYLHSDSSAVQLQQVMGGHCDIAFVSVGEAAGLIEDGSIKGLAVMSDERRDEISSVPTFKENNLDLIYGAFRGYACHKDVPEEQYEILKTIFEESANTESVKNELMKANINYSYKSAKEFEDYIIKYKESVVDIAPLLQQE